MSSPEKSDASINQGVPKPKRSLRGLGLAEREAYLEGYGGIRSSIDVSGGLFGLIDSPAYTERQGHLQDLETAELEFVGGYKLLLRTIAQMAGSEKVAALEEYFTSLNSGHPKSLDNDLARSVDEVITGKLIPSVAETWKKRYGSEMPFQQRAFMLRELGLNTEARTTFDSASPLGQATRAHRQEQIKVRSVLTAQAKAVARDLLDDAAWKKQLREEIARGESLKLAEHRVAEETLKAREELLKKSPEVLLQERKAKELLTGRVLPGSPAETSSGTRGGERGEDALEQVRGHSGFRSLQDQLRSLGNLEGDPGGLLRLLQQRGLLGTINELMTEKQQPHRNLLLLAVIGDSTNLDLIQIAKRAAQSLGQDLYGLDLAKADQAFEAMASMNLAVTSIMNELDKLLHTEAGSKPKEKDIESLMEERQLSGGAASYIRSFSGSEKGNLNLTSIDFANNWDSYLFRLDSKLEELRKVANKLGVPGSGGQENFNSKETLQWLEKSGAFGELEKLARSHASATFIRDALGLKAGTELTEKHVDDFLERYFLKNVTMNEGEGARMQILKETGADIARDSNWPIGDVLKALLLNRPDYLKSVQEFSVRIQGEPVDKKTMNEWRDALIKMARVSLELAQELVQAFVSTQGVKKFPPSPNKMEALVARIEKSFPSIRPFWIRVFSGLSLDDQLNYKFDMDAGESKTKSITIRENYQYPHPTKSFLEFWKDMILTVEQIEITLKKVRAFNRGQTEAELSQSVGSSEDLAA